jgi:hypothetical protein
MKKLWGFILCIAVACTSLGVAALTNGGNTETISATTAPNVLEGMSITYHGSGTIPSDERVQLRIDQENPDDKIVRLWTIPPQGQTSQAFAGMDGGLGGYVNTSATFTITLPAPAVGDPNRQRFARNSRNYYHSTTYDRFAQALWIKDINEYQTYAGDGFRNFTYCHAVNHDVNPSACQECNGNNVVQLSGSLDTSFIERSPHSIANDTVSTANERETLTFNINYANGPGIYNFQFRTFSVPRGTNSHTVSIPGQGSRCWDSADIRTEELCGAYAIVGKERKLQCQDNCIFTYFDFNILVGYRNPTFVTQIANTTTAPRVGNIFLSDQMTSAHEIHLTFRRQSIGSGEVPDANILSYINTIDPATLLNVRNTDNTTPDANLGDFLVVDRLLWRDEESVNTPKGAVGVVLKLKPGTIPAHGIFGVGDTNRFGFTVTFDPFENMMNTGNFEKQPAQSAVLSNFINLTIEFRETPPPLGIESWVLIVIGVSILGGLGLAWYGLNELMHFTSKQSIRAKRRQEEFREKAARENIEKLRQQAEPEPKKKPRTKTKPST